MCLVKQSEWRSCRRLYLLDWRHRDVYDELFPSIFLLFSFSWLVLFVFFRIRNWVWPKYAFVKLRWVLTLCLKMTVISHYRCCLRKFIKTPLFNCKPFNNCSKTRQKDRATPSSHAKSSGLNLIMSLSHVCYAKTWFLIGAKVAS